MWPQQLYYIPSTMQFKKAKSRKYQGVFEVKSRVKTWQVRGIWSKQLEHKQVPQWGTEPGVRKGKRSLLACHTRLKCSMETTHNRWRSSSVSRSWNWWKGWWFGSHCWSRIRMSFNIRERDISYRFLNEDFKRPARYPCLSSLLESHLVLRIKHSYEEQARAYRIRKLRDKNAIG